MPTARQISVGAAWLMLFKIVDKSVGFISTLVLARLLMPEDFGLVAMATAVVAMTQLMNAFGFDAALIQRREVDRSHYDTAWTFNVLLGSAIAVLLLVLAWPTASFYNEPRLRWVLPIIALGSLAGGFENIGTVAFRKDMDFRSEFRYLLTKRLAPFGVTLLLAFTFRNYWALVLGTLFGRCSAVWISYSIHPFRPRLSLTARHDLLGFSKWLFLSSLVSFLQTRSVDFILGRTLGSHALGLYSIGTEIATMTSTELIAPINRAVYPAYTQLAADAERFRLRAADVYGAICSFALPAAGFILLNADAIVGLLLGPKWGAAVPVVRVMTIGGLVHALQSNLFLILVSTGRPKIGTMVSAAVLAVSLPAMFWFSTQAGILGAAMVSACANAMSLVLVAITVVRLCPDLMSFRTLVNCLARPLLGTALTLVALWPTRITQEVAERTSSLAHAAHLATSAAMGLTIYLTVVLVAWKASGGHDGPERHLTAWLTNRWRNRTQK